jgi:hypothetical protein
MSKATAFKVPAIAIETWVSLQNMCLTESEIRAKIARICAGCQTVYTAAQVQQCQDYAVQVYKASRQMAGVMQAELP